MNVDALITVLTVGEKLAVLLWVKVRASFSQFHGN
jgi:hypothetical protein